MSDGVDDDVHGGRGPALDPHGDVPRPGRADDGERTPEVGTAGGAGVVVLGGEGGAGHALQHTAAGDGHRDGRVLQDVPDAVGVDERDVDEGEVPVVGADLAPVRGDREPDG